MITLVIILCTSAAQSSCEPTEQPMPASTTMADCMETRRMLLDPAVRPMVLPPAVRTEIECKRS